MNKSSGDKNVVEFLTYEEIVECSRCNHKTKLHVPVSFDDIEIFRCNRCARERLLHIYVGGQEMRKWLASNGNVSPKASEVSLAVKFAAKPCECGGSFLEAQMGIPISCPKCQGLVPVPTSFRNIFQELRVLVGFEDLEWKPIVKKQFSA